jgi:hypothetical protein
MDLRLPKHYLHMGIMLIRWRSGRTYLHQLICEIGIRKDKDGNSISLIHLYLHSINHIWILIVLILHWYLRLARRRECERMITIQCEQYGGTVHLFIGTRHNSGDITYISLTLIYFHNTKHQGLSTLCPFSVIIMLGLHHYIKAEAPWLQLRRSFLLPSGFIFTLLYKINFHPEAEVSCNNPCHTKNIRSVTFLRTFGGRRPPTICTFSFNSKRILNCIKSSYLDNEDYNPYEWDTNLTLWIVLV